MQPETSIKTERKAHNHGASISPFQVETMLATGKTVGEIADLLNIDRGTLYYRRRKDPRMKIAFQRGMERWNVSNMPMLERPSVTRQDGDTGAQLEL